MKLRVLQQFYKDPKPKPPTGPTCLTGKKLYATKEIADKEALTLKKKQGWMRSYYCVYCWQYHLTRRVK